MKLKSLLLLCFAFAFATPPLAQARTEVSFDFFYDSLSPHGEWLEVGDYGRCWRPRGVDSDWSPYSDGYWSYTDGGWTWVSYEDFGGIVYHYGRWVEVDGEGWCWVPDDEWAPAWVSWRSSDDYVGWAPLPPEARWRRDTGISVWVDSHYDIGPSRYNFCRVRDFGAPYLRPVICHRRENVVIIARTANVTNISYYDGGGYGGLVHCGGPSYFTVNRYVDRPIPALKLVRNTNITNINIKQVNVFNSVQRGNQLAVLAPRVSAPTAALVRPKAVRTIPAAKVNRGWAGVNDPAAATAIRATMQRESRGLTPESAPARRVQAAELKMVPKKADPNAPSPVKTAKARVAPVKKQTEPPAVAAEKPVAGKEQPEGGRTVDPRMAEKAARERARESGDDKPVTTDLKKAATARKPAVAEVPKVNPPATVKSGTERKAPRSIPPATANPPETVKKTTVEAPERKPVAKPLPKQDDAAERARAAARQRAVMEERERSAASARQRVVPVAPKKTQVQQDDGAEAHRRQLQLDSARREQSAAAARMRQNDDRKQESAQAAARQRQIESARQQQSVQAARERMQVQRQAPTVQRQQPPPQVQRQAPVQSNGKRKLSAEELAEQKKKDR